MIEKNFVVFYSPGTFFDEEDSREIETWDVEVAKSMATEIVQRYGARPFAFRFITRGREANELDSRVIRTSSTYYLGGTIETRAEIEARNSPGEEILRSNLRNNNIDRVIVNRNSFTTMRPLQPDDVILDFVMPPREPQAA